MGVASFLEAKGLRVVETDIGDRIIQICKGSPSHPTGPAAHLSAEFISGVLSEYYNKKINSEPSEIVSNIRDDVRKSINQANVGITGANSIAAEGAVLVLHNEGNIFKILSRQKKWVIFAGIDKIYPTIEDCMNAAKVQTFYATGAVLPSFIEVVSGVSKTADVEKKLIKGVQEPEEVVLILVDNGRNKLIKEGMNELLYCIGCGSCVINCPSYAVHGEGFKGGRFALMEALQNGTTLEYCLSCGKCRENCPLSIDIPQMIKDTRQGSELYNFLVSHVKWVANAAHLESLLVYSKLFGRC